MGSHKMQYEKQLRDLKEAYSEAVLELKLPHCLEGQISMQ
jgi:hypothetical protein